MPVIIEVSLLLLPPPLTRPPAAEHHPHSSARHAQATRHHDIYDGREGKRKERQARPAPQPKRRWLSIFRALINIAARREGEKLSKKKKKERRRRGRNEMSAGKNRKKRGEDL